MAEQQRPPIFIVAPSRRCGTTLIQRALNSSGSAIIYGENFIFLEIYPALLPEILNNLPMKRRRTDEVRGKVLGGDYDIDASALFPSYDEYAKLMRDHFYRLANYYQRSSAGYGRSVWGLKHQIRNAQSFAAFMQLVPGARYVFVYRNVFDVARSDRARFPGDYRVPESFAALGRKWSRNMEFMRAVNRPNVIHLEYTTLQNDADRVITMLETHCGVPNIDRQVFYNRINVSPIIDKLSVDEALTSYRPPADLNGPECEALRAVAGDDCARFGYAVPDWATAKPPVTSIREQPQATD